MSDISLTIPDLESRGKWHDYRKDIWGDSFNWSWERTTKEVQFLVIHHTVTKHEATADDIALLHKARGWAGIGYHFVITKDGIVHYVGDVGTARANVLDMNEKVIGITMVGDFTKHLPSDDQILSAHDLCKFFLQNKAIWPNLTGWEKVVGHKELQATACPGNDWKDTSSSLYNRIVGRIPYTPAPEPPTPPEEPPVNPQEPEQPENPPVPEPPEVKPPTETPLMICERDLTQAKERLEKAEERLKTENYKEVKATILMEELIKRAKQYLAKRLEKNQ